MNIELISILIATIATIAAWKSAMESKKAAQGQLVVQLRNEFSSAEMHQALMSLSNFSRIAGNDLKSSFQELSQSSPKEFDALNSARRLTYGYFKKIEILISANLIRPQELV